MEELQTAWLKWQRAVAVWAWDRTAENRAALDSAKQEWWRLWRWRPNTASRPTALAGLQDEGQALSAQRLKPGS